MKRKRRDQDPVLRPDSKSSSIAPPKKNWPSNLRSAGLLLARLSLAAGAIIRGDLTTIVVLTLHRLAVQDQVDCVNGLELGAVGDQRRGTRVLGEEMNQSWVSQMNLVGPFTEWSKENMGYCRARRIGRQQTKKKAKKNRGLF